MSQYDRLIPRGYHACNNWTTPKFDQILDLHRFKKMYVVYKESYFYVHRENTTNTFWYMKIFYRYIGTLIIYTLLTRQYVIRT